VEGEIGIETRCSTIVPRTLNKSNSICYCTGRWHRASHALALPHAFVLLEVEAQVQAELYISDCSRRTAESREAQSGTHALQSRKIALEQATQPRL
jgi:hypothetical protein